jgi:hypothetical protein
VLLFVEQALDREPIDRQLGVRIEPPAHGAERNGQQLRIEPGTGLLLTGEEDLHLLPPSVDRVVPLVLVVVERGEVPHAIAEDPHGVHGRERREQLAGPLRQCSLERGERGDRTVQLVVRPLPGGPIRTDR